MSKFEDVISCFKSLNISHQHKAHAQVDSFPAWIEAMKAIDQKVATTKTLVLKPGKGPNSNLIMVVSLDSTPLAVNVLAKSLGYKDARMASDDAVQQTFKIDKINCNLFVNLVTPFALANVEEKSNVTVVVDHLLLQETNAAFRAFSGTESMIVPITDFKTFMGTHGGDFQTLEFANLKPVTPAANDKSNSKSSLSKSEKDGEKEVLIGLTVTKEENFPKWYEQILTRTEMLDYYDVSGCYIIRPYAFAVWKNIQKFFGGEIEDLGVEDCYFPMFVTEARLNKEKDHIEGFSPEGTHLLT